MKKNFIKLRKLPLAKNRYPAIKMYLPMPEVRQLQQKNKNYENNNLQLAERKVRGVSNPIKKPTAETRKTFTIISA